MYIVFEGIDNAGKTTQVFRLYDHFLPVEKIWVKEPTGHKNDFTDKIADLIQEPHIGSWEETFLFMAARGYLMKNTIIPALDKGEMVISDRSIISTLAYQSVRGLPRSAQTILQELYFALKWPRPDIVFFLDLDVSNNRNLGGDKFERMSLYNRKCLVESYRRLASASFIAKKWHTIDATRTQEDIADEVYFITEEMLAARI